MKATEHDIQSAFFDWLKLQKIDGVELAFAVPNGGARHKKTAGMLKAEGVKAGVPDVLWHPSHEAMGVDPTVQAAAARTEQLVRSMQVAIANLHRAGGGVQGDLLGGP